MIPLFLLGGVYLYRTMSLERSFREIPKAVVNFEALKADSSRTDYASEKGTATLIVLSASWCPGCLMEIPMLQKFHREYGPKGLKILMIDEDDDLKAMARFQKAKEMSWTVVHWNYDAMNALGNPGVIPVSYLVDGSDNIDKVFVGDADESELRRRIEKLVKKD
ncbi:MAG: TlpA family protein disulfide reductase [Fibrobacter sp.]|nr:TlpA family protein disulfide reductase [Fibrobacter sp.]